MKKLSISKILNKSISGQIKCALNSNKSISGQINCAELSIKRALNSKRICRYAVPIVDGVTIKDVWGVNVQQPGAIEGITSSRFTRICLNNVKLWGSKNMPWMCRDVSGAALGVQPWPCAELATSFSAGYC